MENKLLISLHFYIFCNQFNREPIRRLFRMLLLLVIRNLWWIGSHLLTLKTAPKQKSVYFHILQSLLMVCVSILMTMINPMYRLLIFTEQHGDG